MKKQPKPKEPKQAKALAHATSPTTTGVTRQSETRVEIEAEAMKGLQKATGNRTEQGVSRVINQTANALVWPRRIEGDVLPMSVAIIGEMAPSNATEAMLAVQMIAVNDAALMFIRRATADGQSTEVTDANVARAARLMRIFTEQVDAMQRLQGKAGQQKVTVEHVQVHAGGQAIVGAVNVSKPDKGGG